MKPFVKCFLLDMKNLARSVSWILNEIDNDEFISPLALSNPLDGGFTVPMGAWAVKALPLFAIPVPLTEFACKSLRKVTR